MNEVAEVTASAYTIPTETPEADGTIAWESTMLVLVEAVAADGTTGLGYSYAAAAARLVRNLLAERVVGTGVMAMGAAWEQMVNAVRNVARPGIAAHAIVEYFHDHARIEQMLFDGAPQPEDGLLKPDPARPGLGLALKRPDAEKWRLQV